jgi:hypothetical protein
MHDLITALAYFGLLFVPVVFASVSDARDTETAGESEVPSVDERKV